MGQALKMCVGCENPRGCDTCTDLHNWIMERLDAEPVRHGEWIDSTVCVGSYECSQCRTRKRGNQPFFNNVWNYCPNCGAKMDGKDTNVPTKAMDGGKEE